MRDPSSCYSGIEKFPSMKIVTVVGARPQFIKAASVSREIRKHPEIQEIIVHTGQHFDKNMSDVFFEEMQIPRPDYNLNINSMSHGAMTGRMMEGIENVLLEEKPDCVIVYGDTNSTLAGAVTASKLHIPVAHVEAGLRSFNKKMPEEINRILTDHVSDFLFCPTDTAVGNLQKEGFVNIINDGKLIGSPIPKPLTLPVVINVGDVMYDAAMFYSKISEQKSKIVKNLRLEGKDFALCTIHRAENTDDPKRLRGIFDAFIEISKDMCVILPLHPRTRKILESAANDSRFTIHDSLLLIEPVSYFDMIELLKRTRIVMTDSGGMQKEAFFFRKPCITLRDETEWIELVEHHVNYLSGTDASNILSIFKNVINSELMFDISLYGSGKASETIIGLMSLKLFS